MSTSLLRSSFVLALAIGTGSSVRAAPPGFDELARLPAVRQMQLSPSGNQLALSIPVDSARTRIGVLDLQSMQVRANTQLRGAQETFGSFMWVNDRYLLLSLASTEGGFAQARPTGELATLDVETGRLTYAFGYRGGSSTVSRIKGPVAEAAAAFPIARMPDDNSVLIRVARFGAQDGSEIRVLDVASGRSRRVSSAPIPNANFVVDHAGDVRLAFGGASFEEHVVYVREDKRWRVLEDRKTSNRTLMPLLFARDNRHVYARTTRKDKPDAIVRIDLDNGKEEVVYAGDVADPGPLVIPSFDQRDLAAVLVEDGIPALHWLDSGSAEARLVASMQPQLPGHVVLPVSASEDGQRVLLLAQSDRNDGDYYLFDRTAMKAHMVMSRRPWLDIEALAPMRPIALTSRDGLDLHGYLTLPTASEATPPLVVMPHGGPHGIRDRWGFDPLVQALATRGFAVLQINFRGSGGYGQDFIEIGYRQWGRSMQDDVTDATRWAIESGQVDGNRVALFGASYGGYATLMGAAREPDLYRCAISYVGVSDLPLMHKDGDISDNRYGRSYLDRILGNDLDELRANSPSHLAARIKAKVFLVHGAKDVRVPLKQAEVMRDALRQVGNEAQWYVESDEAHGFVKPSANEELFRRVDTFLRECFEATSASAG